MNYHAKRKLARSSMYIALALAICTVMCLTVVAFVGAARSKKRQPSPLENSDPTTDTTPKDPTDKTPSENEKPSGSEAVTPEPDDNKTDTKPDGTEDPDTPTGSEGSPEYVLPADGYVLKSFSVDLPVWSLTMEDYRAHTGIDVSAACGSAVYAMTGGVITDISEDPLMGVSMTVIHHDGNTALYQNLASDLPEGIAEGVTVEAGQVIAAVGDSALIEQCETDHLHLEIFTSAGERINPETLLDFSKVPTVDNGNE